METIDKFTDNQNKAIKILKSLNEFLEFGKNNVGADIEASMIKKIQTAVSDVESEKLKVALIGGFSEGKTSIAAAWLDKLDKSTMKISEQESSNEVEVYEVPGQPITLIDTPGLFGFREQENADTKKIEKYKDITKKYISEAHIILYVMNSSNPIKESHSDDLIWLFRDLNLLPRTIFVLSRFDEVADVEDEDDYNANLKIKKENIIGRLTEVISLTSKEKKDLIIVAVSANPFGEGTEKWLANPEEFKKLSHIDTLKKATTQIIEKNGSMNKIIYETQKSVINDIIGKQLPEIKKSNDKLNKEMGIIEKSKERYKSDMISLKESIQQAKENLSEFFKSYFSSLIMQVNGTSPETFQNFFITEIGDEGSIINSKIQRKIESETQNVDFQIRQTKSLIENEVSHYNSAVGDLVKQGTKMFLKNVKVTNTTVKAVRDFLHLPIKFKPWQAVKIAGGVMKALPLIGVALDIFSAYSEAKHKDEFEKAKREVADNLSKQQAEWLGLINSTDFAEQFFPNYIELVNASKEVAEQIKKQKEHSKQVECWYEQGIQIATQFKKLANE